ncbi:MAG: hypothetical protein V9E98_02275 [Candidatus Nanopelagicales bacterium]
MRRTALLTMLVLVLSQVPAGAVDATYWCAQAETQVIEWSAENGADQGRPYVVSIDRTKARVDRIIESPTDGVVLKCVGRAKLSNGLHARARFGFKAIAGQWYLFLKRAH